MTDPCRIEITAYLSRHNSDEDRRDNARWMDLVSRVAELVAEYDDIEAQTTVRDIA